MKIMKSLTLIISALAVVIAGCGKGEYKPYTPATSPATTDTTAAPVDPITKFNTVWAVEQSNPVTTAVQRRTLANFLGYSKAHFAATGACKYGYTGDTIGGYCFADTDTLKNYFPTDSSYKVLPGPKDLGGVESYKIRFAANVDQATRKIIAGDAYVDVNVVSSSGTFNIKFSVVKAALTVVTDGCGVDCDQIKVILEDDCGDIGFSGDVVNGDVTNPKITFLNKAASYKNAQCYSDSKLPNSAIKNYADSLFAGLPSGIDTDAVDAQRGQIFKVDATIPTLPIPSLVEQ